MSERYYWDACVFLSYINGVPDRVAIIDDLLSRSRLGEFEIVTSTLSIVEVAFAATEKATRALDPAIEKRIENMWADRRAIKLADVHQLLEREARRLIRISIPNNWGLKPADAIHLATANNLKVTEIYTYDPGWKKYEAELKVPICEPRSSQMVMPGIVVPTIRTLMIESK
jgi:predicted nucleic acid-binding protein